MKILVLGGTGAMGKHLVKLLAERGDDVFVTSRRHHPSVCGINYIKGNAHDVSFFSTLLNEDWDVIVDFMVYSTEEFGTRINDLLKATKQYIFLSSSRVYANSTDPITEESPRLLDVCLDKEYLMTDEYALAKARQENILRESGRNNYVIIRPYITYSENRLQLGILEKEEWLFRAMKGKTIVFPKSMINKKTTLTYGLDLTKALVSLIGDKQSLNQTFHITQDQSCTWGEVLDIYIKVLEEFFNKKAKVILCEDEVFFKLKGNSYQIKYDRMYDRVFDSSKIDVFSSTQNFYDIKVGLTKCLNSFLINPSFDKINWGAEVKKDILTDEWSNVFSINGLKPKLKYLAYRFGIKK